MSIMIRRARLDESALLSDLLFRSKAHWGYLPEFLDTWRSQLVLSPEKIASGHVYVAEEDGQVLGYLALNALEGEMIELDDLFVSPEAMSNGVGRRLWDQAVKVGRDLGYCCMEWDADPFAEPFYRHMGAYAVGFTKSTYFAERILPRMAFDLF